MITNADRDDALEGVEEGKTVSRDHAQTAGYALDAAKVRIRSAGWWDDDDGDGERYFRFVLELKGECPKWTFGQILTEDFALSLSSAEQVSGQVPRTNTETQLSTGEQL